VARTITVVFRTYTVTSALPYPDLERAMAGLCAQLQLPLVTGELPDWGKLRSLGGRRLPMPVAGCGGSAKPR
jgi:hypothetical protein